MSEESVIKIVKEVASGAVSSLLSDAVDFVKEQWYAYNEKALEEIGQIQSAYTEHCLSAERSHLTLSTLNEKEQTLPLHFRMDQDKDVPLLFFDQNFQPQRASSYWKRRLSQSDITNFIEDMLGYACEYQVQRDKRIAHKKGYYYDPTNLFFEEFKEWLVKLSHAHIESNSHVLPIIQGRINYLSFLIDHMVFKPGKNPQTRQVSILYMRDILENNIKPTVELARLKKSARDHFKQLKLNVQRLIKEGAEFLFYIFRNSEDTPTNFIIAQIREPTLPLYQSVLKDRSGHLLRYLMNTPSVQLACPEGDRARTEVSTYLTIQDMTSSHFLDDHNQLMCPLNTKKELLWYQADGEGQSGILSLFQTEVYMTAFLKLHKNLEELSIFYLICGLIFELAGEGGNLLVYRYVLKDVRAVIHRYKALMQEFNINVHILWGASEQLTKGLIENTVESTAETEAWRVNKKFSSAAHKEIAQLISDNSQLMNDIEAKIIEVNTPEHLEWVKKQTEFLSQLTALFCKIPFMTDSAKNAKPTITQIEANASPGMEHGERKIPKKEISAIKATGLYNFVWNAYQSKDYQCVEKNITSFLASYHFDTKLHNDLLILRCHAHIKLERFDLALSDIDEALNHEPNNIQCRLNKIYLLQHFFCYQDAKREVDDLLKIDGGNKEAIQLKKEIDEQLLILKTPGQASEKPSVQQCVYRHFS